MPKADKKKKKKTQANADRPAKPPKPHHVLKYAALGKTSKLARLLTQALPGDLGLLNSEGDTALHLAAQHGHKDAAALLVRQGADCKAENFSGNTPAHLAASGGHAAVLALLLQAESPADPAATNNAGVSIAELTQALMSAQQGPVIGPAPPSPSQSPQASESSDFSQRLRQEAGLEDPYDDGFYWDGEAAASSGPPQESWEDEDAYAERIWHAMRGKAAAQPSVTPATAAAWGPSAPSQGQGGPSRPGSSRATEEKLRREAEAAANSARILEEERARDAAFRQAVLQGDVVARRAKYEARWASFLTHKLPGITPDQVPWLGETAADVEAVALAGVNGQEERKRRLRAELMRWHPDKFAARFGRLLAEASATQISERVNETSQILNSLNALVAS